jgi:O-methyltransferase domain/Dimerisation domain
MRIISGYRASRAIHVAATLGIADLLQDGLKSVDELAEATGTHAPTLRRLLRALASMGIFTEVDGRYGLTPLAEHLRTDAPGSVRAWAMNIGLLSHWTSWGHLLESVRTGEPAFPQLYGTTMWDYRAGRPEENAIFNAAMTSLSAGAVDAVVRSYDFSGIHLLVDVGGGEGSLLGAILAANPTLRGVLFDQPHVVATAGALLEQAGVAERCEVIGGSFFDSVPAGADAYLLKSIIHDWDDDTAIEILRRCRAAIAGTGKLLVVEAVVQPGNEPDPAKLSDLNMLVLVGGQERTAGDFGRVYSEAGFRLTRILPTGSGTSIVEGAPI